MAALSSPAVFAEPTTPYGALRQLRGPGACFDAERARDCARDRLLEGTSDLAISPDGRHVYVAVAGPAEEDDIGPHLRSAVLVFIRARATGRLRRLPGAGGCVREKGGEGCATGRALRTATAIEVSSDGRHVYVVGDDGIVVLGRDPATGAVSQAPDSAGCVTVPSIAGCAGIRGYRRPFPARPALALGPRGRYAYLLGDDSLAGFVRGSVTGRLTQLRGEAGCLAPNGAEGCAPARRLGESDGVVVSPDGRHLYRMSMLHPPELELLQREPRTKILRERDGRGACFSSGGVRGCTRLRGVGYVDSGAISPDGRHLYAAMADQGLAAFARNGRTGMLRQLAGAAGCVLEDRSAGCASARGVDHGRFPAVSPDGRNIYLNGGSSLVAFARNRRTGELHQLPGKAGCIAEPLSDDYATCAHPVQRNWATGPMAVSPDGRQLYSIINGFLTVYARRTSP